MIGKEEIAALIGAVYVIARIVVLLTPTKVDDRKFKGVSGMILKLAQNVFGLDVNQGLKKYKS
jgi:hypothetical protein